MNDRPVLTDPRLPPVEGTVDDAGYELRWTTMAEVEAGLAGVIGRLAADEGRWILIIEIGPTPAMVADMGCETGMCLRAYLQWLCCEDGSFVAEVSSNDSLHPVHVLDEAQEAHLLDLGWHAPAPGGGPNFSAVFFEPASAKESARMAVTTMRSVFGAELDEPLLVKMVESDHRGPTPLGCRTFR